MTKYQSPGVFIEPVVVDRGTRLETGVPAFVGFAAPVNTPLALGRREELAARCTMPAASFLADVVGAFFDNGGTRCYVVGADADPARDPAAALVDALGALDPLEDPDLVAVPDAMVLDDESAIHAVQRELLAHCARHADRFAILDALRGATAAKVLAQRRALTLGQAEPVNGALYHPWLKLPLAGPPRRCRRADMSPVCMREPTRASAYSRRRRTSRWTAWSMSTRWSRPTRKQRSIRKA